MIPIAEFLTWVQTQDRRPVRAHIRFYLAERGLLATRSQVRSLYNRVYRQLLKCDGRDYPSIDYTPASQRAAPDTTPIAYSAGRDLAVISETIEHNGFALAETTTSLEIAHSTHTTATVSQQKSFVNVVKSMTSELALKDVKLLNAEELGRRDRELAADRSAQLEEARRDKAFLQHLLTGKGTGKSMV